MSILMHDLRMERVVCSDNVNNFDGIFCDILSKTRRNQLTSFSMTDIRFYAAHGAHRFELLIHFYFNKTNR